MFLTGPMVDSGAPYSAIEYDKLFRLGPSFKRDWIGFLDEIPIKLRELPHWQCGIGDHSSKAQKSLALFILTLRSVRDCLSLFIFLFLKDWRDGLFATMSHQRELSICLMVPC